MRPTDLLLALAAVTWSEKRSCTTKAFSVAPSPLVRHRVRIPTKVGTAQSGKGTDGERASSVLSARRPRLGKKNEGSASESSSTTDRLHFCRDAAVALLGGSWAIFTGSGVALAVGVQPGERTTAPPNALLLVPALRAKLATQDVLDLLADPEKWDQARDALKNPPLAPSDFKTCFRTYSDADPEQHLAFDLYRIQAQEALKAVSELLSYLASEKAKGAEIMPEDVADLNDAGRSVLQGIDDFLKLAPREDVLMVEQNTKAQADIAASKSRVSSKGRLLEGAVVGEGAFVSGTWLER